MMLHHPEQVTHPRLAPPPGAVWYALERSKFRARPDGLQEFVGWERCENEAWGNKARWWRLDDETPLGIAQRFGDGVYRVIWTTKDRRQRISLSEQFTARGLAKPGRVVPGPDDDDEDVDDEEELDDEPSPPQPLPPSAPDPPPPAFAGFPRQPELPTVPAQFHDPALNSVVTLWQLLRGDTLLFHQQLMAQLQLTVEAERQRSRETIAAYQAQFQIIEGLRVQGQRQAQAHSYNQLAGALQEIAQRVDALSGEQEAAQLQAPMGENATNADRLMHVVSAIASSPFGEQIARALVSKLTGGQAPSPPMHAVGHP